MDAIVYPQPVGIGMTQPSKDEGLARALAELKAAQASQDQVWQARAARRVARLQQQRETRSL